MLRHTTLDPNKYFRCDLHIL